jgi:hypothetical protein
MLSSYKTTYKVATRYTPYQLAYGLHPLMPIEHIEHIVAGEEHRDNTLVRVLTSKVSKLEKLQEARMQAIETNGI